MLRHGLIASLLVAAASGAAGAAIALPPQTESAPSSAMPCTGLAVLPPDNLTGQAVVLDDLRAAVAAALAAHGVAAVPAAAVDAELARARIRYTGGLSTAESRHLAARLQVSCLLVSHVDLREPGPPPQFSLHLRLVAVEPAGPVVRWTTHVAGHGLDERGILDLKVVDDPKRLEARLVDQAVAGLVAALAAEPRASRPLFAATPRRDGRFKPRSLFVAPSTKRLGARRIKVAVLPFRNETLRRGAGEAAMLHTLNALAAWPGIELVEPGVVREALLRTRTIQEGGLSLAQAEVVQLVLEADLLVVGTVGEYREGRETTPLFEVSLQGIDIASRRVVWAVRGHADGMKGVRFFGLRQFRTVPALAATMIDTLVTDVDARIRDAGRAAARATARDGG